MQQSLGSHLRRPDRRALRGHSTMAIPQQTVALLKAARQMVPSLPADAVLILAETAMDWDAVRGHLGSARLLVVTQNRTLRQKLADRDDIILLEVDGEPIPTQERMSLAL